MVACTFLKIVCTLWVMHVASHRRESDKVTRAGGAWGDWRVCGCGGGVRGVNRLFSGMFCDVGGSFDVCWFETVD